MPALDREEYVEQAYFFRVLKERLEDGAPMQEVLLGLREEILATTRLPTAIDFLIGELKLQGHLGDGMRRLSHYFTSFQSFIITRAETEKSRLDFLIALHILEQEAEFRSQGEFEPAALFIYQFECIARNRLGYDDGLLAAAGDPAYPEVWQNWIRKIRFDLGTVDFADLIYHRSQQSVEDRQRLTGEAASPPAETTLFSAQAGRIARANRGKDPLYMFAALQRQLGYPRVPRPRAEKAGPMLHPQVEMRLQRLETKLALVEQEQRGELDLSKFYSRPNGPGAASSSEE